ncbi:ExeA family protein [Succinivibrio dextrinosolvens]|uniref:ExeA family protein n=1 Tax=Succinivibrio dextrinosolvens TaxID=83771 RepID=UPI001923813A|nr:AAA family ATPase [Succinivibrio dextrinosolvens]
MYEKFFGLDELPFDGLPDNRFYFVGNCQHEALDLLTTNLSRNGSICILSGPSGSGKTTLVRMLIRSLPKRMRIIAIDDPRLDEHMLLATILRASGVVATSFESIAELTLKLRKFLERSVESGIVTTVILDEAQGLADEVIEQIRLISNIEGELGKMINFLLVGQEDLIENIQKPMHKMFWGRVKAFATLHALKRDEVQAYINFRMQTAGCHDPVFTSRAVNTIFRGTKGLPRIINSVADRSLCIACDYNRKTVSSRIVKKAIEIVRHKRSLFSLGYKNFAKHVLMNMFVKLPIILSGIFISILAFVFAYIYLYNNISSVAISSLMHKDQTVMTEYHKLLNNMLPGRNANTREIALFNNSIKESVFESDSIDTLIKLWGYTKQDGSKATCADLSSHSMQCEVLTKELSYLSIVNRPAVLSLRSDDLTPFFAVVKSFGPEESSIIMGDRLYRVKTEFLEHAYDGKLLFIGKKLKGDDKFEDKVKLENFSNALKRISALVPELKLDLPTEKKELKKAYDRLKGFSDENVVFSVIDNALAEGPYLE